jgi:hypothetical protein
LTGRIIELARSTRSGRIQAEDGSHVIFAAVAVSGDFDTLAVGHRVRFDLDDKVAVPRAIRVFRELSRLPALKKDEPKPDLRYAGFDQAANVRQYKFDAVSSGHAVERFVVSVDLSLLLKHHVGMQEAPALCLHKLTADLETAPAAGRHELGNDDLLAYAVSRAALAARKRAKPAFRGRRGSPPPIGGWRRAPEAPPPKIG